MKRPKRIKVYRWSRFFRDDGGSVATYTCRPRRKQASAVEIQTASQLRQLSDPRSKEYQTFWFDRIFLSSIPMSKIECVITLE